MENYGFMWAIATEVEGFSGGIWILWDGTIRDMLILSLNEQSMTLAVNGGTYVDWILTAVYASPKHNCREELWFYLKLIVNCSTTLG